MRTFMKLATALLLFTWTYAGARAEPLVLGTEPYPPFIVVENGVISGTSVRLVEAIMKDTGQDYRIEVLPWARAIALARKEPMRCVFAAARTPDREGLFKWVAPFSMSSHHLVAMADSHLQITSMDDAKRHVVGAYRGDFTESRLLQLGFPRIDTATDFEMLLGKLLKHRVDLIPMSDTTFEMLTDQGEKLEKTVLLAEVPLGIACNRTVPDALIARMQANLLALPKDDKGNPVPRPAPAKSP